MLLKAHVDEPVGDAACTPLSEDDEIGVAVVVAVGIDGNVAVGVAQDHLIEQFQQDQ